MREFINIVTERYGHHVGLAYHGTTSKFLQSILQRGLIADPVDRVYDKADRHAAYDGVYFSDTIEVAAYRGSDAVDKFGGHLIIVIAELPNHDIAGDEDAMHDFLEDEGDLMSDYFHENPEEDEEDEDAILRARTYAFETYFEVSYVPSEYWQLEGVPHFSEQYRKLVDKIMHAVGPTVSGGNREAKDFRSVNGASLENVLAIIEFPTSPEEADFDPDPTVLSPGPVRVVYGQLPSQVEALMRRHGY